MVYRMCNGLFPILCCSIKLTNDTVLKTIFFLLSLDKKTSWFTTNNHKRLVSCNICACELLNS